MSTAVAGRRVLVVGAGLVGTATAAELVRRGAEVTCADLDAARAAAVARQVGCAARALDLGDRAGTRAAVAELGPALVVHTAGRLRADGRAGAATDLVVDTVRATAHLTEACVAEEVPRLVLASSLAVYGSPDITPVPESWPCRPRTPYGAAKAAAEATVLGQSAGTATVPRIARLCGVYGPGARPDGGQLAGRLMILLARQLTGRPVRVGAGLSGREYLYADDAARGLVALATAPPDGPTVANLGTGRPLSAAEVAEAFGSLGGPDVEHDQDQQKPTPWQLDTRVAADQLGFTARFELARGLADWAARIRERGPWQ
ncbi:NAD-dependent epimerase/dehydratase family protein [Kitasatospora mediocidica]|uniref:NAD-dependent epimerase/dehydratase family protein n=1 Tax=Kitasatospora mediocidica TaxID=58352 RepID=UPI0005656321|nr:NAD(P)-dependent oxidoreductase [Kitasatospora mediocidica]